MPACVHTADETCAIVEDRTVKDSDENRYRDSLRRICDIITDIVDERCRTWQSCMIFQGEKWWPLFIKEDLMEDICDRLNELRYRAEFYDGNFLEVRHRH